MGFLITAPKQRVYLPFEHEGRTRTRSFQGPAFTLKTEVSCPRPSMDAQVQEYTSEHAWIEGNILYNETFRDAGIDHALDCVGVKLLFLDEDVSYCFPGNSNCSIPSAADYTSEGWATDMCMLAKVGGITEGEVDMDYWQISDDIYGPGSMIFLVLAMNGYTRKVE
ncbi:hypothetical protein F4818DRAFT_88477 [Hypoxylon cercidicola]|nr:hypothetical protein F4818DRAFT_88477 [Hypoxylon cercidicola]